MYDKYKQNRYFLTNKNAYSVPIARGVSRGAKRASYPPPLQYTSGFEENKEGEVWLNSGRTITRGVKRGDIRKTVKKKYI